MRTNTEAIEKNEKIKSILATLSLVCSILVVLFSIVCWVKCTVSLVKEMKQYDSHIGFNSIFNAIGKGSGEVYNQHLFLVAVILYFLMLSFFVVSFVLETDSTALKIAMPVVKVLQYIPLIIITGLNSPQILNGSSRENIITIYVIALVVFIIFGLLSILICFLAKTEQGIYMVRNFICLLFLLPVIIYLILNIALFIIKLVLTILAVYIAFIIVSTLIAATLQR